MPLEPKCWSAQAARNLSVAIQWWFVGDDLAVGHTRKLALNFHASEAITACRKTKTKRESSKLTAKVGSNEYAFYNANFHKFSRHLLRRTCSSEWYEDKIVVRRRLIDVLSCRIEKLFESIHGKFIFRHIPRRTVHWVRIPLAWSPVIWFKVFSHNCAFCSSVKSLWIKIIIQCCSYRSTARKIFSMVFLKFLKRHQKTFLSVSRNKIFCNSPTGPLYQRPCFSIVAMDVPNNLRKMHHWDPHACTAELNRCAPLGHWPIGTIMATHRDWLCAKHNLFQVTQWNAIGQPNQRVDVRSSTELQPPDEMFDGTKTQVLYELLEISGFCMVEPAPPDHKRL